MCKPSVLTSVSAVVLAIATVLKISRPPSQCSQTIQTKYKKESL